MPHELTVPDDRQFGVFTKYEAEEEGRGAGGRGRGRGGNFFFFKSVSDGCEGDGGGTTMKMRMFRWWFSWAGRQHFQEEKIWFGSYTL